MTPTSPDKIGLAVCDALGLDPNNVAAMTIKLAPGQPPIVVVEHYVTDEASNQLTSAMRSYKLVEVEP